MIFKDAKVIGSSRGHSDYDSTAKRGDRLYAMSRGELCDFLECPAKWRLGARREKTAAMEWGSLMDTLILTPEQFSSRYVVAPLNYTDDKGNVKPWNWNANVCKAWRDGHDGAEVIKHDTSLAAEEAKARLFADPEIRELIECSEKQALCRAVYQDDETAIEVPMQILIDLVPDKSHAKFGRSLADLKTVNSAEPRQWRRDCHEHNYNVQAALYLDLYRAATGEDRCEFRHPIQESEPPFMTAKRLMSQEFIDLGRTKYRTALAAYCQCIARDEWPDYDPHPRENLNGWRLTDLEPWMIERQSDWQCERIVNV